MFCSVPYRCAQLNSKLFPAYNRLETIGGSQPAVSRQPPTRREKNWKRILQTNANSRNIWSLKVGLLYAVSEHKLGNNPEQSTNESWLASNE